jgi:putative transposase
MNFQPGCYYHLFNQGNNRQRVFLQQSYYGLFMELYEKYVLPKCKTVNYSLMPNHFHFMIYCDDRYKDFKPDSILDLHPINAGIRQTLSLFTRTVNKYERRSGSLFRQNTKAKCLEDDILLGSAIRSRRSYLEECFYYIHANPLRAGLVSDLSDWPHSGYGEFTGQSANRFCSIDLAEKDCGFDRRTFVDRCRSVALGPWYSLGAKDLQ